MSGVSYIVGGATRLSSAVVTWMFVLGVGGSDVAAETGVVRFDVPATVAAEVSDAKASIKQVSVDWTLSALVVDTYSAGHKGSPPIDHLLVRCRLRDRFPVADFAPRTEVQSDYAGPISITEKREKSEAFGLSVDGKYQPIAGAHLGADETSLRSDATQYQHNAPVQAVVASGTIDRGHGVYFKLRWTRGQVLEGEKHFQLTFDVPQAWRGGLLDIQVMATGIDRQLIGKPKVRSVAQQDFVVAVHDGGDAEAGKLADRLAELDRELRRHSQQTRASASNPVLDWWRGLMPAFSDGRSAGNWYKRLSSRQADPYMDAEIRRLPMPVRVAVLDYTEAAERLACLGDSS